MAKRKAPKLVRPADPEYAAAMADRARGSRAGLIIPRTPRGQQRRQAIDFDRRAAA